MGLCDRPLTAHAAAHAARRSDVLRKPCVPARKQCVVLLSLLWALRLRLAIACDACAQAHPFVLRRFGGRIVRMGLYRVIRAPRLLCLGNAAHVCVCWACAANQSLDGCRAAMCGVNCSSGVVRRYPKGALEPALVVGRMHTGVQPCAVPPLAGAQVHGWHRQTPSRGASRGARALATRRPRPGFA